MILHSSLARYGFALLTVGLTFAFETAIQTRVGQGPPLLSYLPAVTLSAWLAGLGPGLAATLISIMICIYTQIEPIGSLWIQAWSDRFRVVGFALEGTLISALMERLHAVRRRSEASVKEAQRYQDELARSEGQLRAVLDHSPSVIFLKDGAGRYLLANRRFGLLNRIDPDQAAGKTDHDFFPREVADTFRANDRKVLECAEPLELEEVVAHDGGPHTYLSMKFPLFDADGVAYAVGGISTDITERKQAERALEASEQRFRTLSHCSPIGIFLTDREGRTTYTNPRCQEIYGFNSDEALGEGWSRFIHPEDRARVLKEWEKLAPVGGEFSMEYRTRGDRGMVRWVHDHTAPLRSDRGEVIGHVGTVDDITELKEAQARALHAERLAAIGEMVAGLTHESRNALHRSQVCLEMLGWEVEDRPEARNLIGRLQAAQDDLYRLFDDVRTYAAPIPLEIRACDLAGVWREAWAQLESLRPGREDVLREETNGLDLHCAADPFRLGQVFRNILDNALSVSTDPARIVIRCDPAELEAQPALRVAVRDHGPGLSPEQRQRIFEPFFTTKIRGTGLGMAITRRIIEAHGGNIAVGEGTGPGAEIILTLPRGLP
jgi:PAS domain S-box-containing protein